MIRKKDKFISIIWGYHKQMFDFFKEENYHIVALDSARNAGYEVSVYMINSQANIRDDPYSDKKIPVFEYRGPLSYLAFLFRNRNSVVYANTLVWQSLIVPFICRHSIFMAHDSVKRKTVLKQKIENFVFKRFSKIRVISEEEKDFLINQGINPENIKVIPIAIDTTTFQFDSKAKRDNIVFLGNVTPDKKIPTILLAMHLAVKKFPKLKLDIIGEIRDERFYGLVDRLKLNDNVTIIGYVPHRRLSAYLNHYKIYVNSSISEGQCLAAYESACCGAALCLPKTFSFEGVFAGKALFHDVYDHETLAGNIITYLEDENLKKEHSRACREFIEENYSPEKTNQKMKSLFSFEELSDHVSKRILIFAPEIHHPFIEGIQKSAWEISKEIAKISPNPLVLTQISYGSKVSKEESEGLGVDYSLGETDGRLSKMYFWIKTAFKVAKLAKNKEISQCLVFSLDIPFILPVITAVAKRIDICMLLYSFGEVSGLRKEFLRNIGRNIRKFFVQSEEMKSALERIGIVPEKIKVIPFLPNKDNFAFVAVLREKNNFIYMSNASEAAGAYDVLEVAGNNPHLNFTMAIRKFSAKDEDDYNRLVNYILKKKISNIKLERNISDVAEHIAKATAIIIPPRDPKITMSFPLTIMEAFLCETPVIVSNLKIFSSLKEEGLIWTYDNVDELSNILNDIANGSDLEYHTHIRKAKDWARNLVDAKSFAKLLIE